MITMSMTGWIMKHCNMEDRLGTEDLSRKRVGRESVASVLSLYCTTHLIWELPKLGMTKGHSLLIYKEMSGKSKKDTYCMGNETWLIRHYSEE